MEKSSVGKVCKVTASVIFILDFIGALIWGIMVGSFLGFLGIVCASFVFCLMLFAVGEIIDQLDTLDGTASQIYWLLDKQARNTSGADSASAPGIKPLSKSRPQGGWTCSKCGQENEQGSMYCKGCGTFK